MHEESEAVATNGREAKPRVWLLVGEKRGDNAQLRNLARAAGWSPIEKRIEVAPRWRDAKPPVNPSLAHVDRARSDGLVAPWPDLVLLAGRRMASVGLWIERESAGRTKLVAVGKPRGRRADFDLIVAACHYVLPDAANVARHDYPLMHVDPQALAAAAASAAELAALPRPLTAMLIGGPTGGLSLDAPAARQLLAQARRQVDPDGGTLYLTTSRRTPAPVRAALRESLVAGAERVRLYDYDGRDPAEANPYLALLASADRFVVTSDSASMLVETARLGRPLAIAPLARAAGPVERGLVAIGAMRRLDPRADPIPAGGVLARTLAGLGRPIHSRDLSALSRRLVAAGNASWLGEAWRTPAPLVDEGLPVVLARLQRLVDREPAGVV